MLEPDTNQIEIFVDALFRHAGKDGFVSLRAFYEADAGKAFRIMPVTLSDGLKFLKESSRVCAKRAAQEPEPIVFCPPIATFTNKDRAREQDLHEGLALSVECDQKPRQAIEKLEGILGRATAIVASGGSWTNPETGEVEPKLHGHWRLARSACGPELAKLKQARRMAAQLVGGDPSNVPAVHPIRWPGSWHRKGEPKLCKIETLSADCEIELDASLAALEAAVEREGGAKKANGHSPNFSSDPSDWGELLQNIRTGEGYHDALVRLAAKHLRAGTSDGATVNILRGLMEASEGPRDERWQARYDDIPRAVSTAREKITGGTGGDNVAGLDIINADDVEMREIVWMWPGRFAIGKLGLLAGLPDEGKGQVFAYIAARVTCGGEWPCGEGTAPKGSVILLTAEDDLNDTVVPRLVAAGADRSKVHIIRMVRTNNGKGERMFSLVEDLKLLREEITRRGDVVMVQIDPMSAYLGVKKIDSFRTTDVRAVLAPLVQLAAELKIVLLGILHFNKKLDVTNALLRISDSLAFGATARHVYAVIDDADHGRKLMVKGKNNLAPGKQKALAFSFADKVVGHDPESGRPITAPYIAWEADYVDVTASEAMAATNENKSPSARNEAKEFLLEYLAEGAMPRKSVEEAADAHGINERTLRRARGELGIKIIKRGFGKDGEWIWELPARRDQRDGFER
jgi:hypothetical protein